MIFEDLSTVNNELKRKGSIITNIHPGCVGRETDFDLLKGEKAYVFFATERYKKKGLFAAVDDEEGRNELIKIIRDNQNDAVFDWLQKGRVDQEFEVEYEEKDSCTEKKLFEEAGLHLYKKYIRILTSYKSNPYLIPEKGRRRILQDMYEPGGELPCLDDAEELFQINRETFDAKSDDVFSVQEWKKIISEERCLIHREDGHITTYYVWELQGKKLYSNIAVNMIGANHLYNMERRIFEKYWEEGIRTYYAWFDVKNNNALKRGNTEARLCINSKSVLYNYIYTF